MWLSPNRVDGMNANCYAILWTQLYIQNYKISDLSLILFMFNASQMICFHLNIDL